MERWSLRDGLQKSSVSKKVFTKEIVYLQLCSYWPSIPFVRNCAVIVVKKAII